MASQANVLAAPVVWAQRKDTIYLNFDLQDVKEEKIHLETSKLTFEGTSAGKKYRSELNLLKEVDPAKSKYVVRPRRVEFILQKKETGPYWENLLKEKNKLNWLKVDWNKWRDEDEADDDGFDARGMDAFSGGNMDFGNMGGGGGGDEDSDDDDMPDLDMDEKKGEKKEEEKKDEEKKEEKKEEEKKEEEKKEEKKEEEKKEEKK